MHNCTEITNELASIGLQLASFSFSWIEASITFGAALFGAGTGASLAHWSAIKQANNKTKQTNRHSINRALSIMEHQLSTLQLLQKEITPNKKLSDGAFITPVILNYGQEYSIKSNTLLFLNDDGHNQLFRDVLDSQDHYRMAIKLHDKRSRFHERTILPLLYNDGLRTNWVLTRYKETLGEMLYIQAIGLFNDTIKNIDRAISSLESVKRSLLKLEKYIDQPHK